MLCPGCGSYIEEGEPYCEECGYGGAGKVSDECRQNSTYSNLSK